jgi:hypothetical protein
MDAMAPTAWLLSTDAEVVTELPRSYSAKTLVVTFPNNLGFISRQAHIAAGVSLKTIHTS